MKLCTFGGEQAAPDSVLADVPVPQGQVQAVRADRADAADRDGDGWLAACGTRVCADREPKVGIDVTAGAPGPPDDVYPPCPSRDFKHFPASGAELNEMVNGTSVLRRGTAGAWLGGAVRLTHELAVG